MYLRYVLCTNVYNYLLYISTVPTVWYLFISIKPGTLADLLHTSYILFYVLHWNTTTHSIKDLELFWLYLCVYILSVICIAITSRRSNQTRSTTCRTLICCKYSSYSIPCCNLQCLYMYNVSSLKTIYTKFHSQIKVFFLLK